MAMQLAQYQQSVLLALEDVWEFRFRDHSIPKLPMHQITLSTLEYQTETAARRALQALLLTINGNETYAAQRSPTFGVVLDNFIADERLKEITRGTVHGRIGRVKTEYSEDERPLDPTFAEVLLAWREKCPVSRGNWVFPNPNTGGLWHSSMLQGDVLVPVGKNIGIERPGWHTFRHSYRSMLDVCGAPVGVQQKLMRHA